MKTNQKGFTLIEVMIAMFVLTIGILALQIMQGRSIDENSSAGMISAKSMLAASQIEQILSLDYFDPLLTDFDDDGNCVIGSATNQDINFNGIDDNDDPNVNSTDLNEEFGLRHSECCPGNLDPRGNAVVGCVAVADQCSWYEDFNIYWNIAVHCHVQNTKTITIIVVDQQDTSGQVAGQVNRSPNRAEYTYIKDDVI